MLKLLLSVATVSALFIGCTSDTKEEVKATTNKTIDNVAKVTEDVTDTATQAVQKATEKTKEVVDKVAQSTTPVVEEVTTKVKDVAEEVTTSVSKVTKDLQEKVHTATAPKIDGKALFKVCGSCHGLNGEKKALNASKVIQGWSKEQIEVALKGYKAGTYGGAMKGVMLGQVNSLDDDKIEALATYISTL